MRISVVPARAMWRTRSMKSWRATRSSPVVGSSRTSALGAVTSAREHDPPGLAARHLVHPALREVRDAHHLERRRRPAAHVGSDGAVAQDAVGDEKSGKDSGFAGDPAFAVAADEVLM